VKKMPQPVLNRNGARGGSAPDCLKFEWGAKIARILSSRKGDRFSELMEKSEKGKREAGKVSYIAWRA